MCVQVLLLDEITVDMDVVGRLDLLKFFTQECEERGATIIYVSPSCNRTRKGLAGRRGFSGVHGNAWPRQLHGRCGAARETAGPPPGTSGKNL